MWAFCNTCSDFHLEKTDIICVYFTLYFCNVVYWKIYTIKFEQWLSIPYQSSIKKDLLKWYT